MLKEGPMGRAIPTAVGGTLGAIPMDMGGIAAWGAIRGGLIAALGNPTSGTAGTTGGTLCSRVLLIKFPETGQTHNGQVCSCSCLLASGDGFRRRARAAGGVRQVPEASILAPLSACHFLRITQARRCLLVGKSKSQVSTTLRRNQRQLPTGQQCMEYILSLGL
ncbi:Protein of unknown function [Gryllus bimaculatus]|nr:Protein of unknown function [Gryllus bimaculatus]